MTRFDLSTPDGRRRAMRDLVWTDHGFLRRGFRNRHQISPRMARANQPWPFQLEEEAALGTRTIVNLRGESDTGYYALEKEACERLGLNLVDFRFRSRDVPEADAVLEWKEVLTQIEYPAMMHCKSGSDRAGIAAALYMIFQEGQSVEEAMGQLSLRYLHMRAGKTGILDFYLEEYLREAAETGVGFEDWVRAGYDRLDFRDRFKTSAAGRFFTDKVLRRE